MSWIGLLALLSDPDEKRDINREGTDPDTGVGIFSYRLKADGKNGPRMVGLMADGKGGVEAAFPDAVREIDGIKIILPDRLPPHLAEIAGGGGGGGISEAPAERNGGGKSSRMTRGLVAGGTGGRDDAVSTIVPRGSYVLPADTMSGLGGGNTDAGWNALQGHLPEVSADAENAYARGGRVDPVPVQLSHGEAVIWPHEVERIGGGDHARGAQMLDDLVQTVRLATAERLQQLPPPR